MTAPGGIWHAAHWPDGWTVRHVAETTSTNSDLLAALETGEVTDRTALVADHQTAGRGRLDRRWDAPPRANLLVTLGFVATPPRPAWLTHRVGLAVVDAVARLNSATEIRLKWPNDVVVGDAKLAGILAQRSVSTGAVVVGLGLNIGWAPAGAAKLGSATTPAALLADVLDCFDAIAGDPTPRYRNELATIGRDVRVELPDATTLCGRAVDVDIDGRLVVTDEAGVTHQLDVGDVIHLR